MYNSTKEDTDSDKTDGDLNAGVNFLIVCFESPFSLSGDEFNDGADTDSDGDGDVQVDEDAWTVVNGCCVFVFLLQNAGYEWCKMMLLMGSFDIDIVAITSE